MFTQTTTVAAFFAALLFGTPETHAPTTTSEVDADHTIIHVAREAGSFSTLLAAIEAAGLTSTLEGEGPFTVFAPTDEAFAAIPAEDLQALLADKDQLTAVLTYHVVAGSVMASQVVELDSAKTVNGQSVSIEVRDGKVYVDGAQVVTTDIRAGNGVIHVIDRVIFPTS